MKINCSTCGIETEQKKHTGRYCRRCYNQKQSKHNQAHGDMTRFCTPLAKQVLYSLWTPQHLNLGE